MKPVYTTQDLLGRGWTRNIIRRFMPEVDRLDTENGCTHPTHCYLRSRVAYVEATPEWQDWYAQAAKSRHAIIDAWRLDADELAALVSTLRPQAKRTRSHLRATEWAEDQRRLVGLASNVIDIFDSLADVDSEWSLHDLTRAKVALYSTRDALARAGNLPPKLYGVLNEIDDLFETFQRKVQAPIDLDGIELGLAEPEDELA